jgi:hypothetical protein
MKENVQYRALKKELWGFVPFCFFAQQIKGTKNGSMACLYMYNSLHAAFRAL